MYAKLLGALLFACQIILNESSVIHENRNSVINITSGPARPATLPKGYVNLPEDRVLFSCQIVRNGLSGVDENRNSATIPEGHVSLPNDQVMFACQIISNGSFVVHENGNSAEAETSTTTRPVVLPDGYVAFSDVHAAYKVHKEAVSWIEARERCIAEGARLAVADTVEKIQHIYSTLPQVDDWISVGIQFSEATNKWIRIDTGFPLTKLPWAAGNHEEAGNCVGISFSGNALINCSCVSTFHWYVCEIPL